ncbi:hypothetical protein N9043_01845 [bacterium]|nr:hypothetical protein [bacterium]
MSNIEIEIARNKDSGNTIVYLPSSIAGSFISRTKRGSGWGLQTEGYSSDDFRKLADFLELSERKDDLKEGDRIEITKAEAPFMEVGDLGALSFIDGDGDWWADLDNRDWGSDEDKCFCLSKCEFIKVI